MFSRYYLTKNVEVMRLSVLKLLIRCYVLWNLHVDESQTYHIAFSESPFSNAGSSTFASSFPSSSISSPSISSKSSSSAPASDSFSCCSSSSERIWSSGMSSCISGVGVPKRLRFFWIRTSRIMSEKEKDCNYEFCATIFPSYLQVVPSSLSSGQSPERPP